MRVSLALRQWVRMYTRPNCGLCAQAEYSIEQAAKQAKFSLKTIDITKPENKESFNLYAFDVPVVHVAPTENGEAKKVFMHRLTTEELLNELK